MKKLLIAAVALSSMFLVACGSDPCTGTSKCSADPVPTDAEIKTCQDAQKDTAAKCYKENQAASDCTRAKQVCGTDNKTDGLKTLEACKAEYEAAGKCLQG